MIRPLGLAMRTRLPAIEASAETIHVCPLHAVDEVIAAASPSHLITLINQSMMIDTPKAIAQDRHLRLVMNDINLPMEGLIAPSVDHVSSLVAFVGDWDRAAPLLIHCWAGVSRSTAAAYIALCQLNPETSEARIAKVLRRASPSATPNPRLVQLADDMLARQGRMVDAVRRLGTGQQVMSGRPFTLPATLTGD